MNETSFSGNSNLGKFFHLACWTPHRIQEVVGLEGEFWCDGWDGDQGIQRVLDGGSECGLVAALGCSMLPVPVVQVAMRFPARFI
jgi:hypothetical protein